MLHSDALTLTLLFGATRLHFHREVLLDILEMTRSKDGMDKLRARRLELCVLCMSSIRVRSATNPDTHVMQ